MIFEIVKKAAALIYCCVFTICCSSSSSEPESILPSPMNPIPATGSQNISLSVTLGWVCSNQNNLSYIYDLYFGTASIPPLIASGLTNPQYVVDSLSKGSSYYWKIVVKEGGRRTEGTVWNFSTIPAWEQVADFGGQAMAGSPAFSIGAKGYIVSGFPENSQSVPDVWQYDSVTNTWSKKNNFPGPSRIDGAGFSIGDKGYITCGIGSSNLLNDLYEYDQQTDTWTQKASYPGAARYLPTVLVINQKAYVVGGTTDQRAQKDVWEYDPLNNQWTKKADFPGNGRNSAGGFVIGNKGYIGCGVTNGNPFVVTNDFWEYDPQNDAWTRKADFPGIGRGYTLGFSIGSTGYLGLGITAITGQNSVIAKDLYEYNPASNLWTKKLDFQGGKRAMAPSFVIGRYLYFGNGGNENGQFYKDFWRFSK